MTYKDKLKDQRWKDKSIEIKRRDDFECQICGSDEDLNVHHVIYDYNREPWDYPDEALITLCESFHNYEHECKNSIKALIWNANLSGMLHQDILEKMKPIFNFYK